MTAITVLKNNVPTGPFTRTQVAEKLQAGEMNLEDLAFVEGLSQWTPLLDVLAKIDAVAVPPAPPPVSTAPVYSYAATMEPPKFPEYAGFWVRFAAHIMDNLFISIPFMVLWFLVVMTFFGFGVFATAAQSKEKLSDAAAVALFSVILGLYFSLIFSRLLVSWLYHAILESGPHQATWGKRIVGVKVTSISGERISFKHATGRYFSTLITNMTMGIGYLMVAFTERKQTLHDMIASTLVVKSQG
jgi:uncharacterized RDD family membrane protein YckC